LLIGGRFFERIELTPMKILQESVSEHLVIRCRPNDGWDLGQSALLARTVGSSLVLAATLVPVTGLSLLRLSMLVRPIVGGSLRGLATSAVLALILLFGLSTSLSMLPEALDQRVIVEQIFYGDSPGDQRSIDPAARRVSRV
jgi:hypothetical protein